MASQLSYFMLIVFATIAAAVTIAVAQIPYDGVISYRRPLQSRHLASLIKVLLKNQTVSTYMDIDDGQNGIDHNQVLANIRASRNLIVILEPHSLDPAIGDSTYQDPMHQEIKLANDLGLRMVPVFDGYDFPNSASYSQAIQNLVNFQGVTWDHILARTSAGKVIQYMNLTTKSALVNRMGTVPVEIKV